MSEEKKTTSIAKQSDFDYIKDQIELLAKMKLPPTMVETHEVRREGKYMILSKRDNPLRVYDFDLKGNNASVVASQKNYSDKFFNARPKGKYNDENRIVNALSVEVGETQDMIAPF